MIHLAKSGSRVTGIVVSKEISERKMTIGKNVKGGFHISLPSRHSSYGVIYYQFRDSNGKLWRGRGFADRGLYDRYKEGDLLSIVYFKRFPLGNKIESNLKEYYSKSIEKIKKSDMIKKMVLLSGQDPENGSLKEKLAKLYMDENQYEDCIREYSALIEKNQTVASFHANLGYCYGMKNEVEKAIFSYLKAVELAPNDPDHFENLGVAYEKIYKWEEAVTAYKKAIILNPKNKDAVLRLAIILDRLGRYQDGIRYLKAYINYDNQCIEAYQLVSRLAVRKEDFPAAIDYLKKGLEIFPHDPELNFELGIAYVHFRVLEKAKAQLKILSAMKDPRYKELKSILEADPLANKNGDGL